MTSRLSLSGGGGKSSFYFVLPQQFSRKIELISSSKWQLNEEMKDCKTAPCLNVAFSALIAACCVFVHQEFVPNCHCQLDLISKAPVVKRKYVTSVELGSISHILNMNGAAIQYSH